MRKAMATMDWFARSDSLFSCGWVGVWEIYISIFSQLVWTTEKENKIIFLFHPSNDEYFFFRCCYVWNHKKHHIL